MRRLALLLVLVLGVFGIAEAALADGPSGSTECHIQDDDCDGTVDEDTGGAADDDDGDGAVDEDTGTALDDDDGDGAVDEDSADGIDNDLDGAIDEDPADDDGDGAVNEDVADDDADGSVDEDPSGDAADDPGENQVDCNEAASEDVGGNQLYVGENGLEVCNESSADGPQGRIIVTSDDGGYASADGEASNSAEVQGYIRIDGDGAHCGDTSNQDASADQTGNTQEDCDPTAA